MSAAAPLAVRRLDPRAVLPTRAHPGDAGLDLCALEGGTVWAGGRLEVSTGLAIGLPDGHAGLVLPRSGLAARHGITLVNSPGLIDAGYRGEVRVLLANTDPEAHFSFAAGDRIAQLVVVTVSGAEPVEVDELAATPRAAGGFGSSGR